MDWSLLISLLALFITVVSTAATVAGLDNSGRARLAMWTKTAATRTYQIGAWVFPIISLINGAVGIWMFSIGADLPSRKDILNLVLFIMNVGIGLAGLHRMLEQRIAQKEAALQAR